MFLPLLFFFCELKYVGHDVEFFLTVKLQMLPEQIENSLRFFGGFLGFFSFFFFWVGGDYLFILFVHLLPIIQCQLTALALACTLCTLFFFFLFALLSIPVLVERTCTWRGGNPQPTGPSGPPSSAFCSEIILPPHRLPPHSPPQPPPPSLCDGASSAGVAASHLVGRLVCEAAKLPCPSLLMPSLPRRPRSLG